MCHGQGDPIQGQSGLAAVGMVRMALEHLKKDNIVDLDDERRTAMVSNLLVVLCSDRHTQPVVNTGSLYQ